MFLYIGQLKMVSAVPVNPSNIHHTWRSGNMYKTTRKIQDQDKNPQQARNHKQLITNLMHGSKDMRMLTCIHSQTQIPTKSTAPEKKRKSQVLPRFRCFQVSNYSRNIRESWMANSKDHSSSTELLEKSRKKIENLATVGAPLHRLLKEC